jgi:hypothetical protein
MVSPSDVAFLLGLLNAYDLKPLPRERADFSLTSIRSQDELRLLMKAHVLVDGQAGGPKGER